MRFLKMLINLLAGTIELILGVHILLKLFAANPNASFTSWIYQLSEPFIQPFNHIFPSPVMLDRFELDIPAIFALFIYMAVLKIILSIGSGKKNHRY